MVSSYPQGEDPSLYSGRLSSLVIPRSGATRNLMFLILLGGVLRRVSSPPQINRRRSGEGTSWPPKEV